MKRRSTKLRVLAWSATVASVVLLVLWLGSIWQFAGVYFGNGRMIGFSEGRLFSAHAYKVSRLSFRFEALDRAGLGWDFWWDFRDPVWWIVAIPLWVPLILAGGLAGYFWRELIIAKRVSVNACPNCNYNRVGLDPAAACPECGKAPA